MSGSLRQTLESMILECLGSIRFTLPKNVTVHVTPGGIPLGSDRWHSNPSHRALAVLGSRWGTVRTLSQAIVHRPPGSLVLYSQRKKTYILKALPAAYMKDREAIRRAWKTAPCAQNTPLREVPPYVTWRVCPQYVLYKCWLDT